MKPKIAPHIKNQTEYYFSGFEKDYDLESSNQVDKETIRLFFRHKETKNLTSQLFSYIEGDKIEVDNTDKMVEILK